jgi:methylated-DNA-protein-cysteine methyltransferase-like protein
MRAPLAEMLRAARTVVAAISSRGDIRANVIQSHELVFPMRDRIIAAIRKVPRGHVSSYGAIARAAGYPGAARQVAWTLHSSAGLPWHRIVGAGGEIKLGGDSAIEQRLRLESEGVQFRGRRVNMGLHEFHFPNVRKTRQSKVARKSVSPNSKASRPKPRHKAKN